MAFQWRTTDPTRYSTENVRLPEGIGWLIAKELEAGRISDGLIKPTAHVVARTLDGEDILKCPVCSWADIEDVWDCIGADGDCRYCPACGSQCSVEWGER